MGFSLHMLCLLEPWNAVSKILWEPCAFEQKTQPFESSGLSHLPAAPSTHIWWHFLTWLLDLSLLTFKITVVFLVPEARIIPSTRKAFRSLEWKRYQNPAAHLGCRQIWKGPWAGGCLSTRWMWCTGRVQYPLPIPCIPKKQWGVA